MTFGILYDEPIADYHASEAISHTKLKLFADNFPLVYKKTYLTKELPQPMASDALRFGAYFHTLAMEGQKEVDKRYVIAPEVNFRTNDGKAAWAKFEEELKVAGKTYVEKHEHELASSMANSIQSHPDAVALLTNGRPEVTFRHNLFPLIPLQARPDWWNPNGHELTSGRPYVIDIKTIADLHEDWEHQFHKFQYPLAAALTRSVIVDTIDLHATSAQQKWIGPPPDYIYLVIEKSSPFQCALYRPDEITLDVAKRHVVSRLKRLKKCVETGEWPGPPRGINNVSSPEWWMNKTVEELS